METCFILLLAVLCFFAGGESVASDWEDKLDDFRRAEPEAAEKLDGFLAMRKEGRRPGGRRYQEERP